MEENAFYQRQPVLQKETPQVKKKGVKALSIVVIALVVLILGGGAGYLVYNQLSEKDVLGRASNPEYVSELQQKQIEGILNDLEKLILIIEDEQPTVATILDVEVLKKDNPTFYENAINGDILVVYTERAIIFRRDQKKIINVAPVFVQSDSQE